MLKDTYYISFLKVTGKKFRLRKTSNITITKHFTRIYKKNKNILTLTFPCNILFILRPQLIQVININTLFRSK